MRRRRKFSPSLDGLEDRICLDGTVTSGYVSSTNMMTGAITTTNAATGYSTTIDPTTGNSVTTDAISGCTSAVNASSGLITITDFSTGIVEVYDPSTGTSIYTYTVVIVTTNNSWPDGSHDGTVGPTVTADSPTAGDSSSTVVTTVTDMGTGISTVTQTITITSPDEPIPAPSIFDPPLDPGPLPPIGPAGPACTTTPITTAVTDSDGTITTTTLDPTTGVKVVMITDSMGMPFSITTTNPITTTTTTDPVTGVITVVSSDAETGINTAAIIDSAANTTFVIDLGPFTPIPIPVPPTPIYPGWGTYIPGVSTTTVDPATGLITFTDTDPNSGIITTVVLNPSTGTTTITFTNPNNTPFQYPTPFILAVPVTTPTDPYGP